MSELPEGMVPFHDRENGFSLVIGEEDAAECPDCGGKMTIKKPLKCDELNTEAQIDAYRCPECTALQFLARGRDFNVREVSMAPLLEATIEKPPRTEAEE
jgi:predicted RNA-binding Zn-ribbon protein involved in translation (DUF1610 family)